MKYMMEYNEYLHWYLDILSRFHLTGTLKALSKDEQLIMLNDCFQLSLTNKVLKEGFYNALCNAKSTIDISRSYRTFMKTITINKLNLPPSRTKGEL